MAEPLKHRFGPPLVLEIGGALRAVHPAFDTDAFVAETLAGFDELELMPRARQIAATMARHLPGDFRETGEILLASFGPVLAAPMNNGMAPFFYLPHGMLVAEHGLGHFGLSMRVLHALTQRFTAEFAIRPFLEHHRDATLAQLAVWSADPSDQVRRLVSEGTRPRLPWAPRLRDFQRDPAPVLALLERLKDDPSLYVRRSVANNLNDVGKDHPALAAEVARQWLLDATPQRRWIVGHALRSAVKRGEPAALEVLGFGRRAQVTVETPSVTPAEASIGGEVAIAFGLHNPLRRAQSLLVDLQVHYMKARGAAHPKVFKMTTLDLPAGATIALHKRLSLAELTTRRHHPGEHRIEVLVNGQALPLGHFVLRRASPAEP